MNLVFRTGHSAMSYDDGYCVIGSCTDGLGTVLSNLGPKFRKINDILDGTRNLEQCVVALAQELACSTDFSRKIINLLLQRNHIEDLSIPSTLSEEEKERYSRSANYYSWTGGDKTLNRWGPQERIKNSSVLILGVGGIGGAVATNLILSGVKKLVLVDFDSVELSNLNRQVLYNETCIGVSKVKAARETLSKLNSKTQIITLDVEISSAEQLREIYVAQGPFDIVFKAADSPPQLPYWVSDLALDFQFPWIDSSYAGPMISCVTFQPGKTGCYRCLREEEHQRMIDQGMSEFFQEEPIGLNAAIAPTVALAGALAAYEGLRFLCTKDNPSIGAVLHQNLVDYRQRFATAIRSDCPHQPRR